MVIRINVEIAVTGGAPLRAKSLITDVCVLVCRRLLVGGPRVSDLLYHRTDEVLNLKLASKVDLNVLSTVKSHLKTIKHCQKPTHVPQFFSYIKAY